MNKGTTSYPCVRYRDHKTRKHCGKADRCFFLRFRLNGKQIEERVGWTSEGWTAKKASILMARLKEAQTTGEGARTLKEMREQADAKRKAQETERQQAALRELTLADFLRDHYIPIAKRDKSSWRSDEIRIDKRITPQLGHIPLSQLTTEHCATFQAGLVADGLAPATVLQYMAVIRRAFNIAAQTNIDGHPLFTGSNPIKGLKIPKPENARERFLTEEEADALLDAARVKNTDLHDIIALSLNTGLRYGELIRLEWRDVDLVHGILTVRGSETSKPGGKGHLNAEAEAVLRSRFKSRVDSPLVFEPPRGGKLRGNLEHQFADLVSKLGFNDYVTDRRQKVVFHTLRHTFASWLALGGTDIYRIKTLMRHKTITMTMRYAHLIPDETSRAVHSLRPSSHR